MSSRRPRCALCLAAALVVTATACGHDFEPPDRGARVEQASAVYTSAMFDSISWDDGGVRLSDGNTIYAEECRRCHGQLGRGQTDYARERRLEVPSLVEPEWHLAALDSLRRSIFVGHATAMPLFGDGDLSLRQIDAVGAYIIDVLRPEVLGGG